MGELYWMALGLLQDRRVERPPRDGAGARGSRHQLQPWFVSQVTPRFFSFVPLEPP
jgi:hypothetical protein